MIWLTCDALVQTGNIERVGLAATLSPHESPESKLRDYCAREGWAFRGDIATIDYTEKTQLNHADTLPAEFQPTYSPAQRQKDGYWKWDRSNGD